MPIPGALKTLAQRVATSPTARKLGQELLEQGKSVATDVIKQQAQQAFASLGRRTASAGSRPPRTQANLGALRRDSQQANGYGITGGFQKFDPRGRLDEGGSSAGMERFKPGASGDAPPASGYGITGGFQKFDAKGQADEAGSSAGMERYARPQAQASGTSELTQALGHAIGDAIGQLATAAKPLLNQGAHKLAGQAGLNLNGPLGQQLAARARLAAQVVSQATTQALHTAQGAVPGQVGSLSQLSSALGARLSQELQPLGQKLGQRINAKMEQAGQNLADSLFGRPGLTPMPTMPMHVPTPPQMPPLPDRPSLPARPQATKPTPQAVEARPQAAVAQESPALQEAKPTQPAATTPALEEAAEPQATKPLTQAGAMAAIGLPANAPLHQMLGFAHAPFRPEQLEPRLQQIEAQYRQGLAQFAAGDPAGGRDTLRAAMKQVDDLLIRADAQIDIADAGEKKLNGRLEGHPQGDTIRGFLSEARGEFKRSLAAEQDRINAFSEHLKTLGAGPKPAAGSPPPERSEADLKGLATMNLKADASDHDILGVPAGASQAELAKAWRSRRTAFHADKLADKTNTTAFKLIDAAYARLKE